MTAHSAAFAVTPSTGAGQLVSTGLRAVVEFAVINSTNYDGTPAISWVDITAKVIDVRTRQGSTDGAESRAPIGSATFRCLDLSALIGDHLSYSSPIDKPGPGCLIRWGFRTSSTWTPMFSGIVDSIEESTPLARAARSQTIVAYDPLYALAGFRSIGGYIGEGGGYVPGPPNQDVLVDGTSMADALTQLLSFGGFPYDVAYMATAMSSYHVAADITYGPGGLLSVAHLLADSAGCQLYATPDGQLNVVPWSGHPYAATYGTTTSDKVEAPYTLLQVVSATFRSAMADIINVAELQNTNGTYRDPAQPSRTAAKVARYGYRHDAAGWPKSNLLTEEIGTLALSSEATAAVARFAGAHQLRQLSFDTQKPGSGDMWLFLRSIYFGGDRYNFRHWGDIFDIVDAPNYLAWVLGRELYLSRARGVWRLQARHHVKGAKT